MKLGANKNVAPESWVDYIAIGIGLLGVLAMGGWWLISYGWACVCGNSGAWR